jgi:hypothetical protein
MTCLPKIEKIEKTNFPLTVISCFQQDATPSSGVDPKLSHSEDTASPSRQPKQSSASDEALHRSASISVSSNAAGVPGAFDHEQWRGDPGGVASPSGGPMITPRSGVESVGLDVDDLGEDYMDQLDDLEDDPELDAYLQVRGCFFCFVLAPVLAYLVPCIL